MDSTINSDINSHGTITFKQVKERKEFVDLIAAAQEYLSVRGYTEHGVRHVSYVSKTTANILSQLGFDDRTVELGAIAGWIHDIGNAVNRQNHGLVGATLAFPILYKMGMDSKEIAVIISAIGNHEESNGIPVNAVSAALILADKSDAHRTRVFRRDFNPNDIHDRVNYAIKKNQIVIDQDSKIVRLMIFMDGSSSVMDYFTIYMSRMALSEKAAAFLGCTFEIVINNKVINNHTASNGSVVID